MLKKLPVGIKGTGPISDVVQYTQHGDLSISDTTFATESRSAYLMEYPNKLNLVYREAVVPFDCNGFQNNPSFDQLCGGGALINDFQNMGLISDLLTFPNDGHCPWSTDSSKMNEVIDFLVPFLYIKRHFQISNIVIFNYLLLQSIFTLY